MHLKGDHIARIYIFYLLVIFSFAQHPFSTADRPNSPRLPFPFCSLFSISVSTRDASHGRWKEQSEYFKLY